MMIKRLQWLWLSLAVVLLDQYTKYLARMYLSYGIPEPKLPILNFTLIGNQGVAFSAFNFAGGWQRFVFSIIAILVVIGLIVYLTKLTKAQWIQGMASAFIIGGALGNLLDRVRFGSVTDFLDFHWGTWHWPAFNIADSAVVIGVLLFIFLGKSHDRRKNQ